jgi:hypothetical protein
LRLGANIMYPSANAAMIATSTHIHVIVLS